MTVPEAITVIEETGDGVFFRVVTAQNTDPSRRTNLNLSFAKRYLSYKLALVTILPLIVLFSLFRVVNISEAETSQPVLVINPSQPVLNKLDSRVLALQSYLASQNSPLKDYADKLVMYADQNSFDWRLLPSIAAVESKLGKVMPYGRDNAPTSYNAWGWGVYQGKSIYFNSWEDGIQKVSDGLKNQFIDEGMTTPDEINSHYSSNPKWGGMVDYYEEDLGRYYQSFEDKYGDQINSYNTRIDQTNDKNEVPFTVVAP